MSEDCRNDCVAPLDFPRRIFNRPGLARIGYRVGSFADIREALLRDLDHDAVLAAWTHRGADDPGIALLEGASILGDILTFYQELYANEAYLRTAQWRESISDLVRLLGYRLSPGLGGNATFAFEVKGDRAVTVPAAFPVKAQVEGLDKPADFETTDELLAYPWLSRFSLFRPLVWPNLTPQTTEFYIKSPDQTTAPVELEEGDRLLVGDSVAGSPGRIDNAETVIVASTRVLHGTTLVKIKGALKRTTNAAGLVAYKIGRTFRHFGHNGPTKKILPPASATSTTTGTPPNTTTTTTIPEPTEVPISFTRSLNSTTSSTASSAIISPFISSSGSSIVSSIGSSFTFAIAERIVAPRLGATQFPLDAEVQDLPAGVPVVVQFTDPGPPTQGLTMARTVADVKHIQLTWGLLTGIVSLLTFASSLDTPPLTADIRSFQFHETLSPRLTLAAAPREDTSLAEGADLYFFGTQAEAESFAGRRIEFVKPDGASFEGVVTAVGPDASPATATGASLHRLTVSPEVVYKDFTNENPSVVVHGNLVEATQGKSEREEPLGNGDARQVFQNFKLPKAPLTYLLSPGDTPPEVPELEIYVNDRLWLRVASLFGRGADEQVYIVREDAAGDSWVQFGDGKTGARLPSGVKNVVARFRMGTGAFGALKAETKAQAGARLDRLDKIQMPAPSTGGSEPESGDNAREAAPGKIQSLDRLVSIRDFETETLAISGVERASAAWRIEENIPALHVTVLMQTGRAKEIDAVRQVLADFNRCRGPRRFPVVVDEGQLLHVGVRLVYGLAPTFRADVVTPAIMSALGVTGAGTENRRGLFGTLRRRFGEREYATRIEGTVQNVEGVVWAKVTSLVALGESPDPPVPVTVVECGQTELLALRAQDFTVGVAAEQTGEAC